MKSTRAIALVANTRLPSERAQALQVVQSASAFARRGHATTIYYARRRERVELPAGTTLFEHYAVAPGAHPGLREVPCIDWIDALPRALQFWPARLQEWSFSRNAARSVSRECAGALVLSREIECARELVRDPRRDVFLEIHRVPGGATRRAWLLELAGAVRGLIAISGGVRDDLVALGLQRESITVEHDGFEAARFAAPITREAARRCLALDPHAPLVVYTGGLLDWKGVDELVDAARLSPEAQVVVAGGLADDVARLRSRADGLANVRIDGFQPPERVAVYLAAGDLGVVPNRSRPAIAARYTSPLKVFEAMAAGLPLVASDVPALRELLTDGVDAWLAPPDDAAGLAAVLRAALVDASGRAARAQRFRARAPEHTWDARAARILDWMETRLR